MPSTLRHRLHGLLLAALLAPLQPQAHDTWLLPDDAHVPAPAPVSLTLTSGNTFPAAESGPGPEHLSEARIRQRGVARSLLQPRNTDDALRLRLVPRSSGVAAAWVRLTPFAVAIEDPIVERYFDEINASAEQRAAWAAAGAQRQFRERYVKHAKTFVRFGDDEDPAAWALPVGDSHELVPEADPTRLRVGDRLPLRVLADGRPLAGLQLATVHQREVIGGFVASDAEGRAEFRFDRAGWWLIRGTLLRQTDDSGMNWQSHWVSLAVYVAAPPAPAATPLPRAVASR